MSHLLNPSANHAALLWEVPSCNPLMIKARAPLRELIINSFFIVCVCVLCFISARQSGILGCASGLKSLGAGVKRSSGGGGGGGGAARRLFHFCTRQITLTFDHVLCSGSRSHGSCAASLLLPPSPHPPTTAATVQKQICICALTRL